MFGFTEFDLNNSSRVACEASFYFKFDGIPNLQRENNSSKAKTRFLYMYDMHTLLPR